VSIGPAIDPTGLTAEQVNEKVEAWIEGEMRRISPHLYRSEQKEAA
jgi:1-acyl-sn-glycerol-3-phosphate acyltransferase